MNDFNSTNNSTFLPRGFREFFRFNVVIVVFYIVIIRMYSLVVLIWKLKFVGKDMQKHQLMKLIFSLTIAITINL